MKKNDLVRFKKRNNGIMTFSEMSDLNVPLEGGKEDSSMSIANGVPTLIFPRPNFLTEYLILRIAGTRLNQVVLGGLLRISFPTRR